MASHWFNQNAAGSSNNYAGNYPKREPEMDLTLSLGLPQKKKEDDNNNNEDDSTAANNNMLNPPPQNVVPNNNYYPNMNFTSTPYQGGSMYRPVGGHGSHEYQYVMAGQPANPGFVNNFPMNNDGRIGYGSNQLYDMGNYQYSQNMMNPMSSGVENHFNMMNINGSGGSMMASNYNPSGYNAAGTITFPSPPSPNEYTLIDTPARRNRNIEIHDPFLDGSSTVSVDRRGIRRQRTGTYNEPNKRCTNFNCGTTETPMWRRGPLGPKTLCNACGIKYRKEEEKRKAKEASKSSG